MSCRGQLLGNVRSRPPITTGILRPIFAHLLQFFERIGRAIFPHFLNLFECREELSPLLCSLGTIGLLRGRPAPSGARPSTGPEKRSAPRARQRRGGGVARRWQPPARSLRGRDRRDEARVSLGSVVWGKGGQASELPGRPDVFFVFSMCIY